MKIKKLTLLISIIVLFCYSPITYSYENEILFQDDFNDGNADGWSPVHVSGATNTTSLWQVNQGKYGINTDLHDGVGNTINGDDEWSDYTYQLDYMPIDITDANLIFRYQVINGLEHFYEIHIQENLNINVSEIRGLINGTPTYTTQFPLSNNVTYTWKIELKSGNIKIYIKEKDYQEYTLLFDLTDNDPLLTGKIGLRFGLKNEGLTQVSFDNIQVIDNTSVPPSEFPYFSQTDPEWNNEKYDFINSTIGEVGCALSSVAMVFKSHGLDKIPVGNQLVDLNPKTLNNWLNEKSNRSRWGRGGIINWQALTTLARDLNASDSAKYTKLEYQSIHPTSASNINLINEYLNQGNPLIFKTHQPGSPSGLHFLVANAVTSNLNTSTYTLKDPYNVNNKILVNPPDSYLRAGIYTPTESDLSYLLIDVDYDLEVNLLNPAGQSLNQFLESELPLANDLNPLATPASDPYQQYSIKYPSSGEYLLTLKSKTGGNKLLNLQLFDKYGNDQLITQTLSLYPDQLLSYVITVDQLNSTAFSMSQAVSFTTLKQLIQHVYKANEIKNAKIKDQLIFMVEKLEFLYSKNQKATLMNFNNLEKHLTLEYQKKLILNPGYQSIQNEIVRLKAKLF